VILSSLKKNEQKYIKHISTNFYITYILKNFFMIVNDFLM